MAYASEVLQARTSAMCNVQLKNSKPLYYQLNVYETWHVPFA